jgi:hypothetical protein
VSDIFEWPRSWYRFTQTTFRIQSRSQTTPRTYIGGNSVYGPHAAIWVGQFALATERQTKGDGQAMSAFFSRMDGQAQLIRMTDYQRMRPLANRLATPTKQAWSDDTYFDDGTGWAEYPVPPVAVVAAACSRGADYIVLGGLPASQTSVLRRGDLVELRPNGIWTSTPNLYEVQVDANTNSDGKVGFEIRPRLRQGFAIGDMAVLDHPMSVFRAIDDDQGVGQISHPGQVTRSFSLVEAIV